MITTSLPKFLLDSARDRSLVPFVGAGVSMDVMRRDNPKTHAFPTWRELLEATVVRLAEAGRDDYANLVSSLLRMPRPDYLEIAQRAKQGLGANWAPFLRDRFAITREEIDDSTLALARAIWQLGSNLVITTNYDRVLSWACPRRDDLDQWRIQSVSGHVDLKANRLQRPTLWQLHGSVDDPNDLILTPDGYQELYADDGSNHRYRAALETLRHVMTAKRLLFVGFSLNDAYIVRQLDWVQDTFRGCGGPHYLLTPKADIDRMRERLDGSAIVPIVYEKHGEPLLLRLAEIINAVAPCPVAEPPASPPKDDNHPSPAAAVFGQPVQSKRSKGKQTRRQFLAACPEIVANFFAELLDDTLDRGHSVDWGEKAFTISVQTPEGRIGLFYGVPPGVRGYEQPELWAYLPKELPADLRAWGWKQYEAAAPFRNGGKYTLKLALDECTIEPARKSVEVLWKLVSRLLRPLPQARGWLVWEDRSEGGTRNFVTHLVSASTDSPFRATKAPLQGMFVTSSTSMWELRWPRYRLINEPRASELWDEPPEASPPLDPEERFIAGAEFVSDGRVVSIGEDSPTAIRRHEGLEFLDRKYDVLGSVGPYVFVRHTEACFHVDAFQGLYDAWFSLVDLETPGKLTLIDLLGEPAIAAITVADGPRASLLLAADPDNWGGGMRRVELVTVAPAYSPAGVLELRCQFTQDVCRADTDGHWSEYTRSQYVPSAFVPQLLEPYRQLPPPVLAWRISLASPAERWGWCPVYDVHADWCRDLFGVDVLGR